jgi:hypothetical protein
MDPHHIDVDDPFADPTLLDRDHTIFPGEATLNISRNASLTLGTDSLIILGAFFVPYCRSSLAARADSL